VAVASLSDKTKTPPPLGSGVDKFVEKSKPACRAAKQSRAQKQI
jgi:hypothetical protein